MRKLRLILLLSAVAILVTGGVLFGKAVWMAAKAQLSQILISRAWNRTLSGDSEGQEQKPWKWADFHPLAKLESESHGFSAIVLDNASGSALAFAPGHHQGSALPGEIGNCIISAHRETYFGFFKHIEKGDVFSLTDASNRIFLYEVVGLEVADSEKQSVRLTVNEPYLTLITCYPFDVLVTGPLRYVVTAKLKLSE